ncbi:MAG TPA: NAD(P)H-hydrate dehydratase [Burkholderiaceae bacterium]|nr:NAD(P)H-hydrate dehydratase [Burkholderiaceae bacterium]
MPCRIDLPELWPSWPLFDAASSRAIEADAAPAWPPHTLMQRAGLAVAKLALATAPNAKRIAIAAGPGNNGGDGFEAALHLHRAGKAVQVMALGDDARRPADAKASLQRARDAGVPVAPGGVLPAADLVVDALLGIGVARAPEGALAEAIRAVNASAALRLAIDVPSGLDADRGTRVLAVEATHTLALVTVKPGLVTAHGRDHIGALWLDDLGCAPLWARHAARARLVGGAEWPPAVRAHAGHKGRYGDVIVIGGAPGMAGAAWLAARAALAAGAGRVYVAPLDAAAAYDPGAPELMRLHAPWREATERLAAATVVCGCGGGAAVREALPALLSRSARLVLDADALNAVAADASLQSLLAARRAKGLPTVLTPHPLEAARLLGRADAADVQADRLGAAESISARAQAVVVLKGSGSVVAAPGETTTVNPTGNASLASPGTGDVLAGWLGGLWSAAGPQAHAASLARRAVWQHGRAAPAAASAPLRAGELIERLSAASRST